MGGYVLSENREHCGECRPFDLACTECEVDNLGMVTSCQSCRDPTWNSEGECHWEGCDEWAEVESQIRCMKCSEAYGIMDGFCFECEANDAMGEPNEFWKDCASCSIDWNNEPWDCLTCSKGKSLFDRPGKYTPRHMCAYPKIDYCHLMVED